MPGLSGRHRRLEERGMSTRERHGCDDREAHRASWVVEARRRNYSAFNGYRHTPSDYSQVRCLECRAVWRTKAKYVEALPDAA